MICVMGAGGRLGRMVRSVWMQEKYGTNVIWQGRKGDGFDVIWDALATDWPPDHAGNKALRGGVILCFLGVVSGDEAVLAQNVTLALAACHAGATLGAAHVFLCSSGAVYGQAGHDCQETDMPVPINAYGQSKWLMEQAVHEWCSKAGQSAPKITLLRIGNVAGADRLLGPARRGPVVLDPVLGHEGGPQRSYIGPISFAHVLARLCACAQEGRDLPFYVNIAARQPVFMADLLTCAGIDWHWGPYNPDVVARVALSTARLEHILPQVAGSGQAADIVAEWQKMRGMM